MLKYAVMHLFTYEDWIWEIWAKEPKEFEGLYDQITANYECYIDEGLNEPRKA